MPAATSRTPPIRRAGAPRPRPSPHMVAASPPGPGRQIAAITRRRRARSTGASTTPCGGCRQRLAEFAGPDTPVHCRRPDRRRARPSRMARAAARGLRARRASHDAAKRQPPRVDPRRGATCPIPSASSSAPASAASPTRSRTPSASPTRSFPASRVSSVSSHQQRARRRPARRRAGRRLLRPRATTTRPATPTAMRAPIATLQALGCDTLILTNAAGSLRTEVAARASSC